MNKRKKILSGIFALAMALTFSLPVTASARDWDHDGDGYRHHHAWRDHAWRDSDDVYHSRNWRWEWERDHYRGYPYAPGYAYRAPGYGYGYRRGYLPPNGEGMVSPRNPRFYWACDSDGHHCHWAPR